MATSTGGFTTAGYQQITVLTSAIGLTRPATEEGGKTRGCFLQAEAQDVRWRDDGTDPTASVGMILKAAATEPTLYEGKLESIKFIQAAATAKLNVTFLR